MISGAAIALLRACLCHEPIKLPARKLSGNAEAFCGRDLKAVIQAEALSEMKWETLPRQEISSIAELNRKREKQGSVVL